MGVGHVIKSGLAVSALLGTGVNAAVRSRRTQDDNYVPKEAFDNKGVSLGLSDADGSTWIEATDLPLDEDDPPFLYHDDAAYYMVGDSGTIVEFWHPFDNANGGKEMAAVHLNIARDMVLDHREGGVDHLRVKVVNKGWTGVATDEFDCENSTDSSSADSSSETVNGSCPALVLAGTTQMAHRYFNNDALPLNDFLADWAEETGWILTDDFIKYYFYDFNYDGTWVAVPLVSDMRVMAYNKTTFDRLDIEYPPGAGSGEIWEWDDFVDVAEQLTLGTGRPGFYFKGSWDEELKLSLMIARNWGATLYKEDDLKRKSCALGDDFVEAMSDTVHKLLLNEWMSPDFIPTDTDAFNYWQHAPLQDPSLPPDEDFCCVDPDFSANSSELWGVTIVPPGTLKVILLDEDIEEALVPGRFSFLGGSGLFVNAKTTAEQQSYGWELVKGMIDRVSTYALVQRSPPPLESALETETEWSKAEWEVPVEQLRKAVPAQYPNPGFKEFEDLENAKPFRMMWMEMKYRDLSVEEAAARVNISVNSVLETECTEENHDYDSCRECIEDDYSYTLSECNPSTQLQTIKFIKDPVGTPCFDGVKIPPESDIPCDHVEITSVFGIAIITVSCLGGFVALSAAALVYVWRKRRVIKFAQPKFCILFSVGVAGLCLSNLALIGENTTGTCVGRVVVWGIAFDLAFGALFSKVYRVRLIVFKNSSRRLRTRRSFLPMASVVSLAMVVDIVILSLWSILDDSDPWLETKKVPVGDTRASFEQLNCSSETGPWAYTFIACKIVLIVWGCYLAWVTRKISPALVEGREITWSIYLFAVLAVILLVIASSDLEVEYWALCKAFVYSLSGCTALVMVLFPKLWGAHKNRDINVTDLMQRTSRNTAFLGSDFTEDSLAHEPFVCSHCNQVNTAATLLGKHREPTAHGQHGKSAGIKDGWQGVAAHLRWSDTSDIAGKSYSGNVVNKLSHSSASSTVGRMPGKDGLHRYSYSSAIGSIRSRVAAPSSGASSVLTDAEVGLAYAISRAEQMIASQGDCGLPPSKSQKAGQDKMKSVTKGVPVDPSVVRPTKARRHGGFRGMFHRSSRDDSVISSSPRSELDAASFARSLQAQAAALRQALRSSVSRSEANHVSEAEQRQETPQAQSRTVANSVQNSHNLDQRSRIAPSPVLLASSESLKAALQAGRIAASAALDSNDRASTAQTVNIMSSAETSLSSTGAGDLIVTGRPPAHRVGRPQPLARTDSIISAGGGVETPQDRDLLQPWVSGIHGSQRCGTSTSTQRRQPEVSLTPSRTSLGISSAASSSPATAIVGSRDGFQSMSPSLSPPPLSAADDGADSDPFVYTGWRGASTAALRAQKTANTVCIPFSYSNTRQNSSSSNNMPANSTPSARQVGQPPAPSPRTAFITPIRERGPARAPDLAASRGRGRASLPTLVNNAASSMGAAGPEGDETPVPDTLNESPKWLSSDSPGHLI